MNHQQLDDTNAIEVTPGIWWVGFADYEAGFSNNPYLLVDGDEAVLFDPGPGHPAFRDIIMQKVRQVIDPEKIRFLVVHHQDPDLCGLIPFIENALHPNVVILAHPRTTLMLPYYGLRKSVLPIGDEDVLQLPSGRRIVFYHAPYLHFAGNMISYDPQTESVFSGDIFALFNRNWSLYADMTYLPLAQAFAEHYMDSKESLLYAYEKLKQLAITRILPQHGGIIEGAYITPFIEALRDVEPGQLLRELRAKPTAAQVAELLEAGRRWLAERQHVPAAVDSLEALMDCAAAQDKAAPALLIQQVARQAQAMGVANPFTFGRVHHADNLQCAEELTLVEAIRRRYLSRHYGMLQAGSDDKTALHYGLLSFRANLGVMFVDIRGFTEWSAARPPDEIVTTLNRYYAVISKLINGRGGRVNKFIGDGVLAYFPERRLADCARVAVDIQRAVVEAGLLAVGIGCDFGDVTMGDIGEDARLDYTIIGAPVNFAARMCDSAAGGEIVLTCRMVSHLDAALQAQLRALPSYTPLHVRVKPQDPLIEGVRFTAEEFT